MTKFYVPARIRQARIARALSQIELAEKVNVTKGAISQYETGTSRPGDLVMRAISNVLDFPLPFFLKEPQAAVTASSPTFFRSLKSTPVKQRQACKQKAELISELVLGKLKEFVEFPNPNIPPDIPVQDSYSVDECEKLAMYVREFWNLGEEPIQNMTEVLQANGFIIAQVSVGNKKIDAFSLWHDGAPFFCISRDKESSVRWRFSLAHELGHLLMHSHLEEEVAKSMHNQLEKEANMFASAFLIPQSSFFRDVSAPSLEHLLYLKKKWKVSVAAMVKKCDDHGIFPTEQITYLYKQISYRGWKKHEPFDDISDNEHPYLLKQGVNLLLKNNLLYPSSIENEFCLHPEELAHWCYIPLELIKPTTPRVTNNIKLKLT